MTSRRLLLVHAHPDDEVINNGVTMAAAVAAGVAVTLVTCTRGEQGEVIPEDLAHLAGDGAALAAHREEELAAAMRALGVTDHRLLGESGSQRYRDSGMTTLPGGRAATPDRLAPDAFAAADLDEAAGLLADVVRQARPQVVLTYEPGGGYGHPDHVMAHRVALRAVDLAAGSSGAASGARPDTAPGGMPAGGLPAWTVAKVYGAVMPESLVRAVLREAATHEPVAPGIDPEGPLPSMVVPDEQVTAVVRAPEQLAAKTAALAAHRSQVQLLGDGRFALANGLAQPILDVEWYALLRGAPAGPWDADGRESDLFAGTGV